MEQEQTALQVLTIPEPCDALWAEMTGDDQSRFCARCDTQTHDLDAMGAEAANQLLDSTPGKLCVRKKITQVLLRPSPRSRRQVLRYLASVAVVSVGGACLPASRQVTIRLESERLPGYSAERAEAEKFLLNAGWTQYEIHAEAHAHQHRLSSPGYEPPRPDTAAGKLHALLDVISRDMVVSGEIVAGEACVRKSGRLVGRRGS